MKKKRPTKGSDLEGNAWAFPSITDARAVYLTVIKRPGFISTGHDLSLDTGFFDRRPVLVFLWGPTVDPESVTSVERLATLAGGNELADERKKQLLRQARLRWRALRSKRPLGGTLQRYHPHGKVWTDLGN